MNQFEFEIDWQGSDSGEIEFQKTTCCIKINLEDQVLTRNEDIWSQTVQDGVRVSAYPLALWFSSCWWRLNYEPLLMQRRRPNLDWLLAHELGAANHGYVWPRVVFASDTDFMHVWSTPSIEGKSQSVRYLTAAYGVIPLEKFQASVEHFIDSTIQRLDAVGLRDSDLFKLWSLVTSDRNNSKSNQYRRIEACLGFDPDECPAFLIDQALDTEQIVGEASFYELAPIYGGSNSTPSLDPIFVLNTQSGLVGSPNVPPIINEKINLGLSGLPWARAVSAAKLLRASIGKTNGAIDNSYLHDLLGLSKKVLKSAPQISEGKSPQPAVGVPQSNGDVKFVCRKRHPVSHRFELARFAADIIYSGDKSQWLASTDLSTSRQKFQRAFAAEFLCPIDELCNFLDSDFSESSLDDASEYFNVSPQTVVSLLVNNGFLPRTSGYEFSDVVAPY
jgi:hypothetical protein